MTREQLEHVIRAAAQIVDDDELVIVGSQAVLGEFPDAPPELLVSNEADVYPKNKPELADLIDGTIGELSPFHETFGYCRASWARWRRRPEGAPHRHGCSRRAPQARRGVHRKAMSPVEI